MKITGVAIVPPNPDLAMYLSFEDPDGSNPYQPLGIEGMDAGDLMKVFSARGQSSGGKLFNFVLPEREVTLKVGLNPRAALGETVSDLRDNLYRQIASTRSGVVDIWCMNGEEIVAQLKATFAGVEPDLFAKRPTVDIRLTCEDPILRAPEAVQITELMLPDEDVLSIGFHDPYSTAPHGLVLKVEFPVESKNFSIRDSTDEWFFTVTPPDGFDPGDELVIFSDPLARNVYRRRQGVRYLADAISPNSTWPIVFPLGNEFEFSRHVKVLLLEHYPSYWGI